MTHGFVRGLACLLFVASFAPAVRAQLFADEAARNAAGKNTEDVATLKALTRNMNAKLETLESQLAEARGRNASLAQKNQQLETRVRALNGSVEELRALVDRTGSDGQVAARQQEIRVERLETSVETLVGEVGRMGKEFADMRQFVTLPPEEEIYAAAYDAYLRDNMKAAIAGFLRVLKHYPSGKFGANCRYYLGQATLKQGEYDAARTHAQALLTDYPSSDKTPAAMLILAQAYLGLERGEEYEAQLNRLIEQHPTSLAADDARQRLARQ